MALKHNAFLASRPHSLQPQIARPFRGRKAPIHRNSTHPCPANFGRDALKYVIAPRTPTKGMSIIGRKSGFVLDSSNPRNTREQGYSSSLLALLAGSGHTVSLISVCTNCSAEETVRAESRAHGL